MGWFKSIFKGITKVFRKVGKFVKKGFKKLGKFMNKLGIVGQIGMMFISAGAANFVMGAVMKGLGAVGSAVGSSLTAAAGGTGTMASIARGVISTVNTIQRVGTTLKTGFQTAVGTVTKTVANVVKPAMKALGESIGMNFSSPVLAKKGGAGLFDTIGAELAETAKYTKDQWVTLKNQASGIIKSGVDPVSGTAYNSLDLDGNPIARTESQIKTSLEANKDLTSGEAFSTDSMSEARESLLDAGQGASRDSAAFTTPDEAEYLKTGLRSTTEADNKFLKTGITDMNIPATAADKGFLKTGVTQTPLKPSLLDPVDKTLFDPSQAGNLKDVIGSSAQSLTGKIYDSAKRNFNASEIGESAITSTVATSVSGLLNPPEYVAGGGLLYGSNSANLTADTYAIAGVSTPLTTATIDFFRNERANNLQPNYMAG